MEGTGRSTEQAFEVLARMTARLASTAKLDEIVETVLGEIVELGFGAVWMAVLDEDGQHLVTLKEVIDGVDTTHEMPKIFSLDMRQPVGHGFAEGRMINIVEPDTLFILERGDEEAPPGRMALPRVIYDHMRGHPFACGPLLGSRGQPVGALGVSSYHGREPIPDAVFEQGLLRAFMDHLGIAMERAANVARLERLNGELLAAQQQIARDARIKAVGELAAAVAHDLNNLTGVALLAATIGTRSPSDALEALPRIERVNRAIGDLVRRLQRVTGHGASAAADTADPRQIIDDTVAMLSPLLREHSIRVDVEVPALPVVRCDPVVLHQLVLNLLVNAQDALAAMPTSARRLRIVGRDDGGIVRLIVSDSGPGIASDVVPQLFKPFVTTKGAGHVGLGLAAPASSLRHFGGTIEGRNAPGGGAVFEVTLPIADERRTSLQNAAPVTRTTTRPHGSILAIDDDTDIVDVIRAYLEPLGYRVVGATEPEQGVRAAATETFDLILCDVGMPRISGLELAQLLRSSGYRGKLILMTGWDSASLGNDRRAASCDMLLKKPFLGTELLHAIDSLLVS